MDTTTKLLNKLDVQEIHFKANEFVDLSFECDPKKLSPKALSAELTNVMALKRFNDIYAHIEENNKQASTRLSLLNLAIKPFGLLDGFFRRHMVQSARQVPTVSFSSRRATNKDELNKPNEGNKENTGSSGFGVARN